MAGRGSEQRHRWTVRAAALAAAALVGLAVVVVLALPQIVRLAVVWRLGALTGRPVSLATAELDLGDGRLALGDLRITGHDGEALATVERVEARFSPRDLLRGHLHLGRATLEQPTVRIVRTGPREFNVSDLLGGAPGGGGPLALTLEHVEVAGGTVIVEDRTLAPSRRWRVESLRVEARHLSTLPGAPPGVLKLDAVAGGSPISVWAGGVRLAPLTFHAAAIAREIDANLAALYLPPGSPLTPARGRLDVSATVEQRPETGARLSLDAVFSRLELWRPGATTPFLHAPAVRVRLEELQVGRDGLALGRLAVTSERAVLEDARLAPVRRWPAEAIAFEARDLSSAREAPPGVATGRAVVAGAPVALWVGSLRLAPLQLDATLTVRDVDAALLRLYVPAGVPVGPERGQVHASLRVEHHAERGTRLALDATLAGLELRRPAHVVTAPALRVTAEDITFGAGLVAVGRAAVGGERLTIEDRTLTPARTWVVRDLALEASRLSSRRDEVQGIATARASVEGASVAAWVTHARLDPLELHATAIVRDLDLALARLYLPAPQPVALDGGRADASLQVEHGAGGTRLAGDITLTGLRARGQGAALGLTVTAPSLRVAVTDARREPAGVEIGRLEITGSGSLTDGRRPVPAVANVDHLHLASEDLSWPLHRPARLALTARLGGGGAVEANGTLAGEPDGARLQLVATDADLALLQPYLPFRAGLRARLDTTLDVAGSLAPDVRLTARGDATIRDLALLDGSEPVLAVQRLEATGIEASWPARLALQRIRVQRSWARLERDRQGRFLLQTLLERTPGTPPLPAPGAAGAGQLQLHVAEGIFEDGSATIVDATTTPPARLQVAGARLQIHDLTWPSARPVRVQLSSPAPGGGRLELAGTVGLDPVRLDLQAALDAVELGPAQPYLPIEGLLAGTLSGDLTVTVALNPVAVTIAGDARLERFQLSDGDRPVITASRAEAVGIDVAWPARVAVDHVRLRRPSLLIERDAAGHLALPRLLTPRWARAAPDPAPPTPAAAPTVEIRTITLERASGRFVDHTTTPRYAEQLSRLDVTVSGLSTAPDHRVRFSGKGVLGGGARLTVEGAGTAGGRPVLELTVGLREFPLPRANPYLDRFTSWTATRGALTASASYSLVGSRLDARHDIVVRGLEVARSGATDEVEQRLGLPLSFLVSLLQDARGEIRLSVPVSGDLGTREFDFREAVWGAVRNLAIRLLALPFSRVGSLFFTEDSKLEGVVLAPVIFTPGTATPAPGMEEHLARVAEFLRRTPSVRVRLGPIFTQADLNALEQERAGAALPPEALHGLGLRRLEVVRQALAERGGIDPARLRGWARRVPLVEAAGAPRVELDLRPEPAP